jgi:integrase
LRDHIKILQQERIEAGDRWEENDLIFPSSIGTPWDNRNMYKYYKRFLEEAGLPDIRFHDLRHTAATLMLQQGVHPKVVQERLGHADITLTLNTYSHVLPAMQEEAAEKLDQLLTPIEISQEIDQMGENQISGISRLEIPRSLARLSL